MASGVIIKVISIAVVLNGRPFRIELPERARPVSSLILIKGRCPSSRAGGTDWGTVAVDK